MINHRKSLMASAQFHALSRKDCGGGDGGAAAAGGILDRGPLGK